MAPFYKTFISVGNARNHFSRMLDWVNTLIDELPQPVFVQHGHTPFNSKNCDFKDFINMDDFKKLILDSKLLIIHGGVGSVLHAIHNQKKPIVIPRMAKYDEHINNHQFEFSKILNAEKKIHMIENEIQLKKLIKQFDEEKFTIPHFKNSKALEIIKQKLETLLAD